MKIVWVVTKERRSCVFEHFYSALEDWKSHQGDWRMIYPKVISLRKFNALGEFDGW
jgi:hypothetical protein